MSRLKQFANGQLYWSLITDFKSHKTIKIFRLWGAYLSVWRSYSLDNILTIPCLNWWPWMSRSWFHYKELMNYLQFFYQLNINVYLFGALKVQKMYIIIDFKIEIIHTLHFILFAMYRLAWIWKYNFRDFFQELASHFFQPFTAWILFSSFFWT